ncbi:MAG: NUDIX hydrolase [Planctomycetota bacterium]|jgi:8-oxo-dGTP pyrophosphatase MutT (NUDIX family)
MSGVVFMVDIYGEFSPSKVRVVWYDEPRRPDARLDALVDQTWKGRLQKCQDQGISLFNGRLARYLRHDVGEERLVVDVGPTDYANFMATNYLNYDRVDELGLEQFGNPLGTSATLITCDGWLIYGRRNQRVACHPGYVHTIGGGIELDERQDDGTFDVFACVLRELDEELGLKRADIEEQVCLGIIRDSQILQPELVFDICIRLSRDEVTDRINPEDPDQEHVATVACRDHPGAIVPFVRSIELIAPIAVGAICLHGRRSFGDRWYERAVGELEAVDPSFGIHS